MSEKTSGLKFGFKILAVTFAVFVVGGLGGVYFDQHVLPFIRINKYLSRIKFLERAAENVTVINKTEQVTIKEDDSINEIASQASNAVVNIISLSSQKDPFTKLITPTDKSGTGIIVTSDGVIATYRDAITEKDAKYQVVLFNGNYYEAKLLGVDEFSNLAFLKIEAGNLTAISFGDSNNVRPGKKIVAIGNASGEYQNRYLAGLLSNINKTFNLAGKNVASSEKMEGVFEDDLGNQKQYIGGPVIGYSGDLIGLVGMLNIDGQAQYFEIPANKVKASLDYVLQNGFQARPVLGATYVSITKEYQIVHSLKQDRGALILAPAGKQNLAITPGSVAEAAGLKVGDIVLAMDGQNIDLNNSLANLLAVHKKGDKVEFSVERGGKQLQLTVKL